MIQEQTDKYIKTCLKGWLLCESCSNAEMNSTNPNYDLVLESNACAQACFDVAAKLLSNDGDMGDLPFNCLVHCRQCVEECGKYEPTNTILACIQAYKACIRIVKEIAPFTLN